MKLPHHIIAKFSPLSLLHLILLASFGQPLRKVPVVLCLGAFTGQGEFCRILRGRGLMDLPCVVVEKALLNEVNVIIG